MDNKTTRDSVCSSVILTDWAADVESIPIRQDAMIYQLLILSLLYDNVLIQDEVFVLSSRVANCFSKKGTFDILSRCFDIGALIILKHPKEAYPPDLVDTAERSPIFARTQYLERYSTKGEETFTASKKQSQFIQTLDSCLSKRPGAQREVGSIQRFDVVKTFSIILRDVLSLGRYNKWIATAFRGIDRRVADDFLGFIENPEKAIDRISRHKGSATVLRNSFQAPIFNRSLAYQVASTYPKLSFNAMKRLIQSVFAAPFCFREQSAGRYGGILRELLWLPSNAELIPVFENNEPMVTVETLVDIKLPLPDVLTEDFACAI